MKSNAWTKIKRRAAQGAGNTWTALTRQLPLVQEGSQAMQKPKPSFYAMSGSRTATVDGSPVPKSTVLVVD